MKIILLVALAISCTGKHEGTTPGAASLFDRVGGRPALDAITDLWVLNAKNDPEFALQVMADHQSELAGQLCDLTGGKCNFTPRTPRQGEHVLEGDELGRYAKHIEPGLLVMGVGDRESQELKALATKVQIIVPPR